MNFFRRNISIGFVIAILVLNICFAHSQTDIDKSFSNQYRIQIKVFALDEFSNASNFAKKISSDYKINSYILQKDGWHKIVLGDFIDYDNADEKLKEIIEIFPEAWIINAEKNSIKISYEYQYDSLTNTNEVKTAFPDSVINIISFNLSFSILNYYCMFVADEQI